MKSRKLFSAALFGTGLMVTAHAWATNGMNLEGYGPIALGSGGASYAYDNGLAAVMNNPATLALADEGRRADLALGYLGPNVNSSSGATTWGSDGDAYYMPAFGWSTKSGQLTWGIASFAQGGMGTEYSPGPGSAFSAGGAQATGLGTISPATSATAGALRERSEVGFGRLLLPVTYNVDERLAVGGTLDYVWANLDLQMAMPGFNMNDMIGKNLINGSMISAMLPLLGAGQPLNDIFYGYFDFTDNNDFTGQAKGNGFAGKLGLTYRVNDDLTIGATYHSKTDIGDLKGSANVSMAVSADDNFLADLVDGTYDMDALAGTYSNATFDLKGKIRIINFQWPAIYGAGLAWQARPDLMIAADIKRIMWSDVMKDFRMSFTANNSTSNSIFAGLVMNATMPQNWDDQTVVQLGVAYQLNDRTTLRAGYNGADNPVPDSTVHYLFPAIIENHYTFGAGYDFDDSNAVNFAMSYAPEVKVTDANGIVITHDQVSWQFMYSHWY